MTTYKDMTEKHLLNELVGKSITNIADNAMTLNDGTVLVFEDTDSCCAWFTATLDAIDVSDNAITAVNCVEANESAESEEAWSLHILSRHKLIAKVNIEGDSTSGYYCHSINLLVKPPKIA